MIVATINFSGNVGKSTLAKHLLLPRIPGAEIIAIESINSDDNGEETSTIRGRDFGSLQEELLVMDKGIIDIGASNVEDVMKLMTQYRGSHEDFDLFVIPAVKDTKQTKDTIATIEALKAIGVPAKKIKVVLNKVEIDDDIESVFYPLIAYQKDSKAFSIITKHAVTSSELYQRMRSYDVDIPALMSQDQTHYKARLRDAVASKNESAIDTAKAFVSMRRLAEDAKENLDAVFSALVK